MCIRDSNTPCPCDIVRIRKTGQGTSLAGAILQGFPFARKARCSCLLYTSGFPAPLSLKGQNRIFSAEKNSAVPVPLTSERTRTAFFSGVFAENLTAAVRISAGCGHGGTTVRDCLSPGIRA